MLYADPEIISCISLEMLDNWKMWDKKVSLVVYETVEMHRHRQFGYRQRIPLPSQVMKELYNVDMREKNDEDWVKKHK